MSSPRKVGLKAKATLAYGVIAKFACLVDNQEKGRRGKQDLVPMVRYGSGQQRLTKRCRAGLRESGPEGTLL